MGLSHVCANVCVVVHVCVCTVFYFILFVQVCASWRGISLCSMKSQRGGVAVSGKVWLKQEVCVPCVCVRVRCLLYTSPSPRDATLSRMPSSA